MTRQQTDPAGLAPIVEALTQSTVRVKSTGYAQWALELTNGRAHRATARLVGDWFMVDLPLGGSRAPSPKRQWRMVTINAAIDGAAKFTLAPDGRRAALRAEIPLAGGLTGQRRIAPTCRALEAALDALASEAGDEVRPAATESADSNDSAERLGALCRESGWTFEQTTRGRVTVQLETRTGPYHAVLTARPDGGVDMGVDVGSADGACRNALATVLLKASAMIRMVRAAVHQTPQRTCVRFEVSLPGETTAAEISEALSALSVACESCGREVRAVQNEEIAQAYLSLSRGRSPKTQRDSK